MRTILQILILPGILLIAGILWTVSWILGYEE